MNALKKAIVAKIIRNEGIGVSAQVLQEFYTVAIRKAEFRLTPAEGLEWLDRLGEFPCASVTQALVKVAAVHDDSKTVAREGGPYADTLYVTVKGPKAKVKVSEVARKANPSEMDWKGKNTLRLWWD